MKASWNGYLRIGELTAPIRLFSAVRDLTIRYTQLHKDDYSPVSKQTICLHDGKELKSDEIIKAVEYDGRYVEIDDDELKAASEGGKFMVIRQFSNAYSIHSKYYEKPYYIVPGEGGELAYTMLRQAFVSTGKAAVVTYVFYGNEHLGIVTAEDGILMLQQLRFSEEIVPRSDIKTPNLPQPLPNQVEVAEQIMGRYSTPFYIEDYRSDQADALNELIERRAKGLPAKRAKMITPEATPEEDLIPMLKMLLVSTPGSKHTIS